MPRNHIEGWVCAWLLPSNRISVVVRMSESGVNLNRMHQTKFVLTQIEYVVYFSVSEIVWT